MARGKVNPNLTRYNVGCVSGVYVMEAGPFIKVGRAYSLHSRLRAVHNAFLRKGEVPGRFATFPTKAADAAEGRCVRALRAVAQAAPGHREFFIGIAFDQALAIVGAEVGAAT
jgi:hypothetical protein